MPNYKNTRLAGYSVATILKATGKKRISGATIRAAYKQGTEFDLQITDFIDPDCDRYVSPSELKRENYACVYIRYNSDQDLMKLDL